MPRLPTPIAQVALAGLNHVLKQQAVLRDGLRAHAGRDVRIIVVGPLGEMRSDARIGPDGFLQAIGDGEPAATLRVTLSVNAVFDGLRGGAEGLAPHVTVDGDLMVAAALADVARSARWDFEEDLSRFTGDVVAHRIGEFFRGVGSAARGFETRSTEALSRGLTTGRGPLIGREEYAVFSDGIADLAARVARLEASRSAASQPPPAAPA